MLNSVFSISGMRIRRLIQGGVLGLGAPAGWLLLCRVFGIDPSDQNYEFLLHTYMALGTIGVFAVFGFIIGRHEQRYAEMSLVDPLTTLFNPRYFHARFRQELARCARLGQPISLLLADIDFFKKVNDTYGHQIGDLVLVHIGGRLAEYARESDIVARVGGEEFAVLLPGTDGAGAMALAERMRSLIEESPAVLSDGRRISFTTSFGVATQVGLTGNAEQLYAAADRALYAAKMQGRNRVVRAPEMAAPSSDTAAMAPDTTAHKKDGDAEGTHS